MRFATFMELISFHAQERPASAAIISESGVITYEKLHKAVVDEALNLRQKDFSCLGMIAPASPEWIITMLASVIAGKRTVLLDPTLPVEILSGLLAYTEADEIYAQGQPFSDDELSALRRSLCPARKNPFGNEGELLFYTSGTTEASKAVVLTSRALLSSAWNGQQMLPCSPDDVVLSILPLTHVFGFVCSMLWPLSQGAACAVGRGMRFYTKDPLFFKPTILPAVPSLIKFLLAFDALNPELKIVLIGAGPCDKATLDAIKKRGISVRYGYGLTETASGLAISVNDNEPYSMALCPDTRLSFGQDGEILVKTTCMMEGYYKNPQATNQALWGGYLHTGDLGRLDSKGRLVLTGRKKDILVLPSGEKVFCAEWEAELSQLLNTDELALITKEGRVYLIVVGGDELKNEYYRKLASFNETKPFNLRICDVIMRSDPLARTVTGKLKRWALS